MNKCFFLVVISLALSLSGCNFKSSLINDNEQNVVNTDINVESQKLKIFNLYKANGGELTYDEWLSTIKGNDGTSLFNGIKEPRNELGKNGDSYIDTETRDFYSKSDDSWIKIGNIKGETGEKGERGSNGDTPRIGENGTWWIGEVDTGVSSQGIQGEKGNDGVSISSIIKSSENSTYTFYTITYSNGKTSTFTVKNGESGNSFLSGRGIPNNTDGKIDDLYINLESFNIYRKYTNGRKIEGNLLGTPKDDSAFYKYIWDQKNYTLEYFDNENNLFSRQYFTEDGYSRENLKFINFGGMALEAHLINDNFYVFKKEAGKSDCFNYEQVYLSFGVGAASKAANFKKGLNGNFYYTSPKNNGSEPLADFIFSYIYTKEFNENLTTQYPNRGVLFTIDNNEINFYLCTNLSQIDTLGNFSWAMKGRLFDIGKTKLDFDPIYDYVHEYKDLVPTNE